MKNPDATQSLLTRRTIALALVLVLLYAIALRLEGMPAWCKYGLGLWARVNTHCTSQHFLDAYSFSHVLHGVIFYWLLRPLMGKVSLHWRLIAAVALECGWEVLENSPWVIDRYRNHTASLDYRGDSILNSLGDVVTATLGFAFASRFDWKASVTIFIAFELFLLYLARDNLTLNILMLFFPIEAVKEWQLGA